MLENGILGGYGRGLEKSKKEFINFFYRFMMQFPNPIIFYNKVELKKYTQGNQDLTRFFVANNTVHHENSEDLSGFHKNIFS